MIDEIETPETAPVAEVESQGMMPNLDVAVCIWRAVMQHVFWPPLRLLAQGFVQIHAFPLRQDFRLFLGQAGAHGKIGLGQEQRCGVIAFRLGIAHGQNASRSAASRAF